MFNYIIFSWYPGNLRLKNRFIIEFTRNLALLLKAGLMMLESLQIIVQQSTENSEKTLLDDLITQLKSGHNFSDCLKQYPKLYNQIYCSLVEVGEFTGQLSEMLVSILEYLEKMTRFRKKFIQVLTYPLFVVTFSILALAFMIFFVLPAFNDLFKEFDSELPLLTLLIMGSGQAFQQNVSFFIIIFIALVILLIYVNKIEKLKYFFHKKIFKVPFWGTFIARNYIFRFCHTLGTLLKGGINLTQSLELVERSISNYYLKKEILLIREFICRGERLSDSMVASFLFPPIVIHMISVGEESGELSLVLFKIASFYEQEIDHSIEILSGIIEPILILSLGIIIGLILIAIYLPLFNMTQLFPG
ncbi:MAG: hypothetical protein A2Y94_13680 [Caldithrix sp. RBG_13_44_9]|nr:MAG: hypothetical protein A2Y94_13680 [Caldithrix sp. RBG_13_44_9]